ncbi:hypothetical protein B6S12_01960 [Helicobacter valdiviensis]|uniref:Uncharacterized protein n=1 Tax=Helicobacter valdiviensis TaxID=1458358 RepID=A0A2W6MWF4_9HELI|nr:hypothetical protein [Helicobacter valdiviensis]PZT48834.1 hypothetical protein B6S12_01960 [Helicobacter valdiviensis]
MIKTIHLNSTNILDIPNKTNSTILSKEETENNIINANEAFKIFSELFEKLVGDIPILEGSIRDQILKGKMGESELKSLYQWMDENRASMVWLEMDGENNIRAMEEIYRTSKGIEEFKSAYLALQEKYDNYSKELANKNKEMLEEEMQEAKEQYEAKSEKKKPFKPIEGKSESETYKEEINSGFWEQFIKIQREKGVDILELLEMLQKKGLDIKA